MNAASQSPIHTFAVCAYGDSPFLPECLESVCSQAEPSRVLVATSTPSEYISSQAEKFGVPVFVNKSKPGIASDWNFALSCVETPLATVAHQDDVYLESYSRSLLEAALKTDNLLIYFTNYEEIRDEGIVSDNELLSVKRKLLSSLQDGRNSNSVRTRRRVLSLGSPICCPSVSYFLPRLPSPLFEETMKCSLDWQTWERLSKLDGDFYYDTNVLMRHRIHEESETSHLIADNTRSAEDLEMLCKFWPRPVAKIINHFYAKSQQSNSTQSTS